MFSIQHWATWLRGTDALAGLPMIIVGLALMLGGWRMGRVCVVLTLAAIGGGVGLYVAAELGIPLVIAFVGAVLMGAVSLVFRRHAVALLGGLLGTAVFWHVFAPLGLQGWPLWIALVLTFSCVAAISTSSQHWVVIVITSFEGAALLVSGLVPILASLPGLIRFLESTSRSSAVFLPFALLAPTLIGCFLQLADSKRHGSESPTV